MMSIVTKHKWLKDLTEDLHRPSVWAMITVLAISLVIIGWAESYPIASLPIEEPLLSAISPLLWIGIGLGFVGIGGWVMTTRATVAHWLLSCLFVLLLTVPQFLYISWGSDAGVLASMVNYSRMSNGFNLARDVVNISYFQWPTSIFFHRFLADVWQVDAYTACQIAYPFVIGATTSGLFLLWSSTLPKRPASTRGVFWGIVVYFVGAYWFLNWQIVPYTFALALFFPMLTLLGRATWENRFLLFVFFCVGLETHALFGVWTILIVALLLLFIRRFPVAFKSVSLPLLSFLILAQAVELIFKDTWFFKNLLLTLEGFYRALNLTGTSDRSIALQITQAVGHVPADSVSIILKYLSWLNLGIVLIALGLATANILIHRRLTAREPALLIAGLAYFGIGMQYAVIGTRSIQLIALVPAYFVVDALVRRGRLSKTILAACVCSLILFIAPTMYSYHTSPNYVKPTDVYFDGVLSRVDDASLSNLVILSDHAQPMNMGQPRNVITTRQIRYRYDYHCHGPALLVDTLFFRSELARISKNAPEQNEQALATMSVFYTSGPLTLRFAPNCQALNLIP